jgi:hypothetical protein
VEFIEKLKGSDVKSSSFCFSLAEIGRLNEKSVKVDDGEFEFEAFRSGFEVVGLADPDLVRVERVEDWSFDLPGLIISIFFLVSVELGRF